MSAYSTLRAACANHRGCRDCRPTDREAIKAMLKTIGQPYTEEDNLTLWVDGGVEFWFNREGMFIGVVRG
jgi:hypothetical protein